MIGITPDANLITGPLGFSLLDFTNGVPFSGGESQASLFSSGDVFEEAHSVDLIKATDEKDTFTFSFIYVKLNGPLFSVGFADVAGLVGAFGIHSDITLPTVEQATEFPFVAEQGEAGNSSPVERMEKPMSGSRFHPAEGLY